MASKRETESAVTGTGQFDMARHIGFLVRKFYQKNQAIWQELCTDPQMTSVQYAVLESLYRNGPSSLTDIGRAAAMDPATTRGVVERLHARDMVSHETDKIDRRKVIVRLNPPALELLREMTPIMPQIAEATLQPLNPAERLALQFLLHKVTEAPPADE